MDENSELTRLALISFSPLTDGEKTLLENLQAGEPTNFQVDDERTIRAEVIAWLCKNKDAIAQVPNNVLEIWGAKITGKLDLQFTNIPFAFHLFHCSFEDELNLQNATILGLNLEGTRTLAIRADGITVKTSVFLRNGFEAVGEVRLLGANINGNLECDKGRFENENGKALNADGITVKTSVFLRNDFKAFGEVCLLSATIGRDLDCLNGHFINQCKEGIAISADGIKVKGNVFLRNGFEAVGEVRFLGATIGGNLNCTNGHFKDENGDALFADGIKVEGNAYFRDDFSADGIVSFAIAKFKKGFVWIDVKDPSKATLDLRYAYIGTLWDDEKSLPNHENLFLQGLEYSSIVNEAPIDAESRKKWIRLQYPANKEDWRKQPYPEGTQDWYKAKYSPQPYEQLASVLRKQGHEKDARDVLIAKEDDRRTFNRTKMGWWEKAWYWLLSFTIRYGYKPFRAAGIGFIIIMIGCVFFGLGSHYDLITPSQGIDTFIVVKPNTGEPLSSAYPKFNVIAYSFDVFLPIIDLHQQKYFLPNANINQFGFLWLGCSGGGLLRIWMWIQIIAGWVLTTLFLGGLTGLIRK